MKKIVKYYLLIVIPFLLVSCGQEIGNERNYPLLILQQSDVAELKNGIQEYPLLKESFLAAKEIADRGIEAGIIVPLPKDPGGGYSHEKHKLNYQEMYYAGLVYQLSGDEKYAEFVRDMLMEYAGMYPELGIHPMKKNQSPGKLFWQGLNESVWLVYSIQAYDCIYDFLPDEEKEIIENKLFKEMVEFFTVEDSYSFDRVHNHGTWAVAGVGMTAMVLGDSIMLEKALYSTKMDGSGGFLRQIDDLFSPDGYYSEGPYYQRYALMPFILFANALDKNRPELKIFEYRDGVLVKAVTTLLQLTNSDGRFYPINDAIKEKSWLTPELIFGVNIAYDLTKDKRLLNIALNHGRVMLSAEGLAVAKSIAEGEGEDFLRVPMIIHDGADGNQGGLALLRIGEHQEQSSVMLKFASQGMGHGHFDRLGIMLYDKGSEILADYGAARFINVAAKEGGRYLDENKSWAKQSIAHNTIILNQKSHFDANLKKAEKTSPELVYADLENKDIQIVSASDDYCYPGVELNRTLCFMEQDGRKYLIDLFNIINEKTAVYDIPYYYQGQIIQTNFPYSRMKEYKVLGEKNGYQHLLVDTRAVSLPQTASITWMNGNGFYTLSSLSNPDTEFMITKLGANDPDFNLREQAGFMLRNRHAGNTKFLNVIEIHGNYNPESEAVLQSEGSIEKMELFSDEMARVMILLKLKNGKVLELFLDLKFTDSDENQIKINGEVKKWQGNYKLNIH